MRNVGGVLEHASSIFNLYLLHEMNHLHGQVSEISENKLYQAYSKVMCRSKD